MYEKNLPTDGRISKSKKQTKNSGGSDGSSALFLSIDQGVFIMKIVKRIMAVLLLFITILAVSYFIYTAKQIPSENTVAGATYEVAKTT